jgi:hypothetical protein
MTTAEVIANTLKTSTTRQVKGTMITVTRTEPTPKVTVVDETNEPKGLRPVDPGKRSVEVLPGLKLVTYVKGYVCLRIRGKSWQGNRVDIGKPLYRDDLKALVDALTTAGQNAKTYEEANGIEASPEVDESAFEDVAF